jgi:hypothetical protein
MDFIRPRINEQIVVCNDSRLEMEWEDSKSLSEDKLGRLAL